MSSALGSILLSAGLAPLSSKQEQAFGAYLELLIKWAAKTNLTAIHSEDAILRRHFVESIHCARLLTPDIHTLLDFGSGAGFPGVPIAICRPEIEVTLAESQSKKAAFLKEALRVCGVHGRVHGRRVADLPAGALFDAVTLRAVDRMDAACEEAVSRLKSGGNLYILTTMGAPRVSGGPLSSIRWQTPVALPQSRQRVVLIGKR